MVIKVRILIYSLFFALFFCATFYVGFGFALKDSFVALDVERMLSSVDRFEAKAASSLELQGMGVDAARLEKLASSSEKGFGYTKSTILGTDLLYIYKTSSGFAYIKETSGLYSYIHKTYKVFFYLVVVAAVLGAIMIWLLSSYALGPLVFLRNSVENLVAGRLVGNISYDHEDEIGVTLRSLKMLSAEIEKKDQALSSISELATTDGMTKLKNYRAFKVEIEKTIAMAKRNSKNFCVILLDVDHFKKFNDTYGHQQGDEVLKTVAKSLLTTSRKTDFVARYGGEEFVLILPETHFEGGKILAEKLRAELSQAKVPDLVKPGSTLSVTASFGLASINPTKFKNTDVLESIVEQCDSNLYKAKKAGRNAVVGSEWEPA